MFTLNAKPIFKGQVMRCWRPEVGPPGARSLASLVHYQALSPVGFILNADWLSQHCIIQVFHSSSNISTRAILHLCISHITSFVLFVSPDASEICIYSRLCIGFVVKKLAWRFVNTLLFCHQHILWRSFLITLEVPLCLFRNFFDHLFLFSLVFLFIRMKLNLNLES